MSTEMVPLALVIPASALLEHWQGHRRLTRRAIDTFSEDQLFSFSIGSMRPFGAMVMEMITIAEPMVRGIVTGEWKQSLTREARPKEEILRLWDQSTEKINTLWAQIPPDRFRQHMTAFGNTLGSSTTCCCTLSTMRSIIAARDMSTCERSASSRHPSTSGSNVARLGHYRKRQAITLSY